MAFIQGISPIWETKRLPNGKLNSNGYILVFDWNTKLPINVYADPAGAIVLPGGNRIVLNENGEPAANSGQVFWDDTKSYELKYYDVNEVFFYKNTQPYIPQSGGSGSGDINSFVEANNLVINGQFQIIDQEKFAPLPNGNFKLAPYNWEFTKTGTNVDAYIEFARYGADEITIDATPARYVRYVSPGIGTDETQADLIFRIDDGKAMANQQLTYEFVGKSELAGNPQVELLVSQFTAPGTAQTTSLGVFSLSQTEQRHSVTFVLPDLVGETLVYPNGVDFFLRMPLNQNCDIRLTNFQINRGGLAQNYDYKTPGQTLAEINGARFPHYDFWSFTEDAFFPTEFDQSYYCLQLSPRNGLLFPEWASPIPVGSWIGWDLPTPPPGGYVLPQGQLAVKNGIYNRLFLLWESKYGVPINNVNFDSYPSPTTVRFRNFTAGSTTSWGSGNIPFTITQVPGQPTDTYDVTCTGPETLQSGDYFTVSVTNNPNEYIVYCIKDNVNVIPNGPDFTKAFFQVYSDNTTEQVAQSLAGALNPLLLRIPDYRGYAIRITDAGAGVDTLAGSRTAQYVSPEGNSPAGDNPGSIQQDGIKTHTIPYSETNYPPAQRNAFKPVAFEDGDPATDNNTIETVNDVATYSGQSETTMKNFYTNIAYKY